MAKPEYELLSYFSKLYIQKYEEKPLLNRYKEKWGMLDAIDSLGYDDAKDCLDYYFSINTTERHSTQFFYANLIDLYKERHARKEDAKFRARLREQTRKLVEGE